MGLGDEIMVTGEARRLQRVDPRPVGVLDRFGRPRWHPLWNDNPRLAPPGRPGAVQTLVNGPGCRPYVDYARSTETRWAYTDWRASVGELYGLSPRPRSQYIVLEPNLKPSASPNKDWGWARWRALVRALGCDWVQLGPDGTRPLEGARHVPTETFREACEVLAGARAAVLPEGGLHHAAAALGVPAVVVFGGMTSPANTGYDGHVNLFEPMGGDSPCGRRLPCGHCRRAMAWISPARVARHLERLL